MESILDLRNDRKVGACFLASSFLGVCTFDTFFNLTRWGRTVAGAASIAIFEHGMVVGWAGRMLKARGGRDGLVEED